MQKTDPCLFQDGLMAALLSHHADDILLTAEPDQTESIWKRLQALMEIKRSPPFQPGVWQQYLGRMWTPLKNGKGWRLKMKDGYYHQLLQQFGLLNARPVKSPTWTEEDDSTAKLSNILAT